VPSGLDGRNAAVATGGFDPGACARCAKKFTTCCVITQDIVEFCFPLSLQEQQAIRAFTGNEEGMTVAANTRAFTKSIQDLFPGEHVRVGALFPSWEFHRHLAVNEQGACVFLSENGCALSRDVRPAYCRIFPFWIRKGELLHFAMPDCQAQRESRTHAGLLDLFDMKETDVHALYRTIRAGWGLPQARR